MIMRRPAFTALIATTLAATALAFPAAGMADVELVSAPTSRTTWVARVVMATNAFSKPSNESKVVGRVRDRAPWNQSPMKLMVGDVATAGDGSRWVKVLLARKPNGTYGWIPADYVALSETSWRVRIDLSQRRVTVFRSGRRALSARAVIGAPATPTPTGLFAVREIVRQPSSETFGGPWILHLNANSEKLKSFDGGDGTIGIHGRGGAALSDPLGSARSHGCVRVNNSVVRYLARHLTGGAPVEVVP